MNREQYEEMAGREDVLPEEVLQGIRDVLVEERNSRFRDIDAMLARGPIERPPLEIGMSRSYFYRVDLKRNRAREILSVIRSAESMYGSQARFHDCELKDIRAQWKQCCEALRAAR